MYYKTDHFQIHELVDAYTYNKYKEKAWVFFNPIALISLDNVRKWFNRPVYVNNWVKDGEFSFRGFRPMWSTVGSDYSQHRFGNAFDFDVKGYTAEEVRQEIIDCKNKENFKYITCLEGKVNWVHMDCRNYLDSKRILIINP